MDAVETIPNPIKRRAVGALFDVRQIHLREFVGGHPDA